MLKRIAHIILSLWLAILLVFGGTSKEFIHLFSGHTDTEHTYKGDGLVIEPEHHHCTFLSFTLPCFLNDSQIIIIAAKQAVFLEDKPVAAHHLISRTLCETHLRGPPGTYAI